MPAGKPNSGVGSGAATAPDPKAIEATLCSCSDPETFCAELSKLFRVRRTEVALLRLENGLLKFLFPSELKTAGSIPVSSATAVAAHTVITKKVELFNSFTKVKHASIFETVKLGNRQDADANENAPIQKLMSAPVLSTDNKVLGVLQVSRKGLDLKLAGADFTLDDLQKLEVAAKIVAKAQFLRAVTAC
jgi:GAF domain-containing protein